MPDSPTFSCVWRSHVGLVRQTNQDAVLVSPSAPLWAVADGMGGHEGGETASALVTQMLASAGGRELERAATNAVQEANRELYRRNMSSAPRGNMGTTVAVLGIEDSQFFCLWAGDSRIYRLRSGGIEQLTRDHRYVQELVDAGALSPAQAKFHPQRNVVTRAVGIEDSLTLDRRAGPVESNDIFILMTDGVSAICTDREIAGLIGGREPNAAADALLARCLERGAPDNLAFVLAYAVFQ